jgi:uncharacterized protein with FMN-binding domain
MAPIRKLHPAVAALIIIVLVGIVTSVVIVVNNNKKSQADAATSTPSSTAGTSSATDTPSTATSPATAATNTSNYKDGSYSATASYVTPGGIESIDLTVTIKAGVIVDSSIASSGKSDHAQEHQAAFASGYKTLVVGKNVDSVTVSRVSGASLTSNAFNDALAQIKKNATA